MPRPSFLPNARQINVLLIAGFLSIGYAIYLRYLVIEPSSVGLACDGGLKTWLCSTRSGVMVLFNNSVFGIAAVALALINLVRPSLLVFTLALIAASFGVVLYNVGLAGLGLGLLMLAFARPQKAAG